MPAFNCAVVFTADKYWASLLNLISQLSWILWGKTIYASRRRIFFPNRISRTKGCPFGADIILKLPILIILIFFSNFAKIYGSIPPSSFAAMAGATVIGNLSASNTPSANLNIVTNLPPINRHVVSPLIFTPPPVPANRQTDLAWDGHAMVYENGNLLAESARFAQRAQIIYSDIDLDRLAQDRMRLTSFSKNAVTHKEKLLSFRKVEFNVSILSSRILLNREYPRFPIFRDPSKRDQRCYEAIISRFRVCRSV